eukprot:CAMPEP_0171457242 /NCGR_PEP_ID=MMETSP0945-20130129/3400_1 /TAXON_ID=109269 /ORGANISM="Vaucheria litorea, Strain CCMP2940" /LENGTH=327 /DNA_ID=CAMNT_0011982813 /DNA_START=35 /DNA_END=1015 /DNA_ORIENTATION=+
MSQKRKSVDEDVLREFTSIRDDLISAYDQGNTSEVIEHLQTLSKKDITVEILSKTKIGKTLNQKIKKSSNVEISKLTNKIVQKWKNMANAGNVEGNSKKEVKRQKSSKNEIQNERAVANNSTAKSSKENLRVERKAETMDEESPLYEENIPPQRFRVREKFKEIFHSEAEGEKEGEEKDAMAIRLAIDVENKICEKASFTTNRQDYIEKARSLIFNLKNNEELRVEVLQGLRETTTLVSMSSFELLPREKRLQIEDSKRKDAESRRLDWNEKNREEIYNQCGIQGTDGLLECVRCKSKQTSYTQKQTRSADEPMTTFANCSNCGKKW